MSDQNNEGPLLDDEAEVDSGLQFVTFGVDGEVFGFPMASVSEIIRVPSTVDVPLTPGALTGLANLRGSVLPILDLRLVLGLDPIQASEATRVIVTDEGTPVGMVVDKVHQVISVDPEQIEPGTGLRTSVNAQLLAGVIKQGQGKSMIQLLDVSQLIASEFETVLSSAVDTVGGTQTAEQIEADEDADIEQLVSFKLDEQEYAFNLMDVEGTLRVPESITKVPQSDSHVLGLIDLRGRLIPLISLRRLFRMPEQAIGENHRILLIHFDRAGGGKDSVGLVVDQVREVLRVHLSEQDEMPATQPRPSERGNHSRLSLGQRTTFGVDHQRRGTAGAPRHASGHRCSGRSRHPSRRGHYGIGSR